MKQFKNLFLILNDLYQLVKEYKKRYLFFVLFFITIFSSFFEILTIGSLIPLMEVLINPDNYLNNVHYIFKKISRVIGADDLRAIIFITFTFLIIVSYLLKIFLIWISAKFTFDLAMYLSESVFKKTISKKYRYFVNSSASMLISNQEKTEHIRGMIFSFVQLFTSLILAATIIIFLFFLNFKIALIISSFSIFGYLLIFLKLKEKFIFLSKEHVAVLNERFKLLIESSENIKEIKLRSLNNFFFKKYNNIILRVKKLNTISTLIHSLPSQVLLMIGTILVLIMMYYYSISSEGLVSNIPFISALVLGLQRVFPQAQNVFVSLAGIKEFRNSLEDIKLLFSKKNDDENLLNNPINNIEINQNFELKKIYFKHTNEHETIFEDANIKFEVGKFYGIKGESGIGKTTIIDVICGLLPSRCEMFVDGNSVNFFENSNWQNNISHLPQNTLLTDSTILENIAYGKVIDEINLNEVEEATKKANILDFIQKTQASFLTKIGEKGIKISGGQRQRISIAKLFYLDKKIFILDESTNALDKDNEEKVFEALKKNNKNKIIIAINHNLAVQKYFDHIYEIKDKKFNLIK